MTETPERPELLPCPFCGEEPEKSRRQDESLWSHDVVWYSSVHCVNCDCERTACDDPDYVEVTEAWNTRASSLGEPVSQEAPVISSASPLSEDERKFVEETRKWSSDRWRTQQSEVRRLLAIIDRLSASAPSPEDNTR